MLNSTSWSYKDGVYCRRESTEALALDDFFSHSASNDKDFGNLIYQGAEAKVWKNVTALVDCSIVIKARLKKGYRVNALDYKINKARILKEAKCLLKCEENGILVPIVYLIDTRANKIFMSFCNGQSLKSVLYQRQMMSTYVFQVAPFFQSLGRILAKMHQLGITHGDLTTSNIMIIAKENK